MKSIINICSNIDITRNAMRQCLTSMYSSFITKKFSKSGNLICLKFGVKLASRAILCVYPSSPTCRGKIVVSQQRRPAHHRPTEICIMTSCEYPKVPGTTHYQGFVLLKLSFIGQTTAKKKN